MMGLLQIQLWASENCHNNFGVVQSTFFLAPSPPKAPARPAKAAHKHGAMTHTVFATCVASCGCFVIRGGSAGNPRPPCRKKIACKAMPWPECILIERALWGNKTTSANEFFLFAKTIIYHTRHIVSPFDEIMCVMRFDIIKSCCGPCVRSPRLDGYIHIAFFLRLHVNCGYMKRFINLYPPARRRCTKLVEWLNKPRPIGPHGETHGPHGPPSSAANRPPVRRARC